MTASLVARLTVLAACMAGSYAYGRWQGLSVGLRRGTEETWAIVRRRDAARASRAASESLPLPLPRPPSPED